MTAPGRDLHDQGGHDRGPDRSRSTELAEPPANGLPSAPEVRGQLSDGGAVALAAAVAAGAWFHPAVPLAAGIVLVGAAFVLRVPWLLVLGGLALGASFGARAHAGLDPVTAGAHHGVVTLVSDPTTTPYGVRVDVRVGSRRVELTASGAAAGAVSRSLAGERLAVDGRLSPPPPDAPWLVPRHVVGRLAARGAERVDAGAPPWRAVNRVRRLLERGVDHLEPSVRSLYLGFVLGDDRAQPPELVDDFRGAGMTHLLVVSGQNVAFVLLLVSPVLERVGWGWRWVVTVGVVLAFGVVTRFEPSVLRASAMAAVAVSAQAVGRPVSSVRVLSLAVAALVLVDPLLVRSVGFQLSVAASAAIGLWAAPLAGVLPGPRVLREGLAVTVAAQVGVAPILVPAFGGLPVVALAANVVAVPVAGLVTTWGLPAGVVAGLAGGGVARLVHVPTEVLIRWVAGVARVAAGLPLGELGVVHVAVLVVVGAVVLGVRHGRGVRLGAWVVEATVLRWAAVVVTVVVLLAPAVRLRSPPAVVELPQGARVVRSEGATVVEVARPVDPVDLLEGLRRAGVRRIDLAVLPERQAAELERVLRHRWPVGRVIEQG